MAQQLNWKVFHGAMLMPYMKLLTRYRLAMHHGKLIHTFLYTGPKPPTPPAWMEETFELNARDVLLMIEEQIGTPDFDGQVEYVPYQEFDSNGDRIYSNNMSAHFAFREVVS